jgi:RNA polymerase sigma-70 factor (ECF subfamily)
MDDAVIKKVLEGDINSFRYLVDKYKDMSFSIAMSILKDEDEAEDVIQDAFVKAFNSLGSFRKESGFSTWLYRIVVNESLGRMRKMKPQRMPILSENEDEDAETEIQETVLHLIRDDQVRYINKVLNIMDGRESLFLRLFYLNENSLNEIEAITGYKSSNIRVILYRARKNFYRVLKNELKEEVRSIL